MSDPKFSGNVLIRMFVKIKSFRNFNELKLSGNEANAVLEKSNYAIRPDNSPNELGR